MDLHCCRQSGAHYAEVSLMSQWSLTDGLESDFITSHLEQLHILAFFFVASFTHFIALFYTPPHSTQYSKGWQQQQQQTQRKQAAPVAPFTRTR